MGEATLNFAENRQDLFWIYILQDEIEKYRKRANSIWTIVVQTCNKEKLPMAEWRVAQAAKEHRLVELEKRIKILQGQQEVNGRKQYAFVQF